MKCDHHDGSRCLKGLYGGRPSPGTCFICSEYEGPSRGRGDTVHKAIVILTVGVAKKIARKCKRCRKTRQDLNREHPA